MRLSITSSLYAAFCLSAFTSLWVIPQACFGHGGTPLPGPTHTGHGSSLINHHFAITGGHPNRPLITSGHPNRSNNNQINQLASVNTVNSSALTNFFGLTPSAPTGASTGSLVITRNGNSVVIRGGNVDLGNPAVISAIHPGDNVTIIASGAVTDTSTVPINVGATGSISITAASTATLGSINAGGSVSIIAESTNSSILPNVSTGTFNGGVGGDVTIGGNFNQIAPASSGTITLVGH